MTTTVAFGVLLFSGTTLLGQSETARPVLSVVIDGWGVVWPQGKHNYLTVLPDGTTVYLHKAKRGLTAQITDGVNDETMKTLRNAITEVAKLGLHQAGPREGIDYRISLEINAEPELALKISHFNLEDPDSVPKAVYRLLCLVDKIRDEPYRVTSTSACQK